VIAYFDTSAVVPLIINEPATDICTRIWNESSRVVSVRLLYPEARAALARAKRMNRLTRAQVTAAVAELDALVDQVDHVEVTASIARIAGELAQQHALCGYDAVHLAAAQTVSDDDLVLVSGDTDLAAAASAVGITISATNA
jgi:hypothetical protein